uniref:Uncharacterized protein n=1 Tax=Rhizophora mucronata TaxID=61149 RepID=A0A2P2PPX6_RHIMU
MDHKTCEGHIAISTLLEVCRLLLPSAAIHSCGQIKITCSGFHLLNCSLTTIFTPVTEDYLTPPLLAGPLRIAASRLRLFALEF